MDKKKILELLYFLRKNLPEINDNYNLPVLSMYNQKGLNYLDVVNIGMDLNYATEKGGINKNIIVSNLSQLNTRNSNINVKSSRNSTRNIDRYRNSNKINKFSMFSPSPAIGSVLGSSALKPMLNKESQREINEMRSSINSLNTLQSGECDIINSIQLPANPAKTKSILRKQSQFLNLDLTKSVTERNSILAIKNNGKVSISDRKIDLSDPTQ